MLMSFETVETDSDDANLCHKTKKQPSERRGLTSHRAEDLQKRPGIKGATRFRIELIISQSCNNLNHRMRQIEII